ELGQLFARLGTEVTILERSQRLLQGYDPEIGTALATILRDEGLHIVTDARILQVRGDARQVAVTVEADRQRREVFASKLLVAAGRRPNTDGIGLERAGVWLDEHGAVLVDAYLRTSAPHIWAAGDVIGRETASQMATPVGAHDGGIAASNALAGVM